MDKDTSEIAKLTERISKDPRSKLFVPLAEEYKKTGDMEMSIHVLREGLTHNPGYVTARSFLGKLLIEKGDLAGAQKEFEEVVKSIPDNLMAQRKLGDLYALQDRPADAVQHYKVVLTINPKDAETAMLIAETEAGRDIKKYLARPKTPPPEEPRKKQDATQASSSAKTATQPTPAPSKQPHAVPAAMTAASTEEEPEEVVMVEPLEPVEQAGAAPRAPQLVLPKEFDFLAEAAQEPAASPDEKHDHAHTAMVDDPFGLQEKTAAQVREEKAVDVPFDLNEPFATEETGVPAQDTLAAEEPQLAAEVAEEVGKQADDFTTDTLAELYISQGFFEKAVDIYERMLVDNPNSQGLKDKLANVRAMAAAAPAGGETSEITHIMAPSDSIPEEELRETRKERDPERDALVPPLEGTAQARLDDWELPAAKSVPQFNEEPPRPLKAQGQSKSFDVGFEPREYLPPDAVLKKTDEQEEKRKKREDIPPGTRVQPGGQSRNAPSPHNPAEGRKETVERLESWLKNIMKER
jgi:tetratricopeptide (TPR) repeat protein